MEALGGCWLAREREEYSIRIPLFSGKPLDAAGGDFRFGTVRGAFGAGSGLPLSWPSFRKLAETVSSTWQVNQSLGISWTPCLRARVPNDLFAAEIPSESVTWPAARMDLFWWSYAWHSEDISAVKSATNNSLSTFRVRLFTAFYLHAAIHYRLFARFLLLCWFMIIYNLFSHKLFYYH